jgi:hypothetical protein
VIVASPRTAALDEARFFSDQLRGRRTTARGVVVNRVSPAVELTPDAEAELRGEPEAYEWWQRSWVTWRAQHARMLAALPTTLPVTLASSLDREVTDLDAVRELGLLLGAGAGLSEEQEAQVLDV